MSGRRCTGDHIHTKCQGKDTYLSGFFPEELAKLVIRGIFEQPHLHACVFIPIFEYKQVIGTDGTLRKPCGSRSSIESSGFTARLPGGYHSDGRNGAVSDIEGGIPIDSLTVLQELIGVGMNSQTAASLLCLPSVSVHPWSSLMVIMLMSC